MSDINENLLETITRELPTLRKSQRHVANAILEDPTRATKMKLAELSRAANVSEPSVIRFCNTIGCDGFQDMKIRLARSLAYARSTSHSAISEDDTAKEVITKVFDFNLSTLNWARSKLDEQQILRAVEILLKTRRIEFLGFGASAIVAMDAQQKSPLFGVPCGAPPDGHQMVITAAMLSQGDTVVAISNTGTTRELIQATRIARDNGASTIAISGNADAPLLRHVDVPIVVETLENTDIFTPTISRIAAMVVIDILSTLVSLNLPQAHQDKIRDMKTKLADFRTSGFV